MRLISATPTVAATALGLPAGEAQTPQTVGQNAPEAWRYIPV